MKCANCKEEIVERRAGFWTHIVSGTWTCKATAATPEPAAAPVPAAEICANMAKQYEHAHAVYASQWAHPIPLSVDGHIAAALREVEKSIRAASAPQGDAEKSLLARKFIRPMDALTSKYIEQKDSAGNVGKFSWCSKCHTHAIANNICAQCGKDDRLKYGDFLFDPDLKVSDISHHQKMCAKFNLPLYIRSEITSFDVPETVEIESATSILNYLRQATVLRSTPEAMRGDEATQRYAMFEAGWNAGFQEAQEPDRYPHQNRCEVLYRELFPDTAPPEEQP